MKLFFLTKETLPFATIDVTLRTGDKKSESCLHFKLRAKTYSISELNFNYLRLL